MCKQFSSFFLWFSLFFLLFFFFIPFCISLFLFSICSSHKMLWHHFTNHQSRGTVTHSKYKKLKSAPAFGRTGAYQNLFFGFFLTTDWRRLINSSAKFDRRAAYNMKWQRVTWVLMYQWHPAHTVPESKNLCTLVHSWSPILRPPPISTLFTELRNSR